MRWLRFLNPFHVRRLEREVAAIEIERAQMVRAREGAKRAAQSFYESIGRQAPAGSETQLRGDNVLLQGRVHALEVAAGLSLQYLRSGRHEAAAGVLGAILDSSPIDQREAS